MALVSDFKWGGTPAERDLRLFVYLRQNLSSNVVPPTMSGGFMISEVKKEGSGL